VWQAIGGKPDPLEAFRSLDAESGGIGRGGGAALKPFRSLLARLDGPAIRSSPAEAIRTVVESVYRDYARAKFPNGDARLDDLEQFAQFAQTYESVPSFLEEVALFNELSGEDVVPGEPDDDRVVLSSIHQAKGLEWSRVVVMGLSEGRFPSYRSAATDEGLEEERRLFYVAVTRAKNEVALVYPMLARDRYGVDVILEPSRFLTELPDAVYERWTIEREPTPEEDAPSAAEDERVH
jgi:DNA helicase-2/ATP-dependent DNA helicase PcrA